jgi:hypothetical protein
MKRVLSVLASLLCVIGLLGCNDRNRLTLDKIVELSAKGEDLNWSDFEQYESKDVGSGLYIYYYDIDDTFGPNITKFFQTARHESKNQNFVKY